MAANRLRAITVMLAVVVAGAASALAHDTLDGAAAEDYIARLNRLPPEASRTPAQDFAFGAMAAEIIKLLNQDRSAHAGDHSLLASVVMIELEKTGVSLALDPVTQRYRSHLMPFERYLGREPDGPNAAEARHNVIVGRYRDTVLSNPFSTAGLSWEALTGAADASHDFLIRYPEFGDADAREELAFIVAMNAYRAVLGAPDDSAGAPYKAWAGDWFTKFLIRFPDSIRAAAARNLLGALGEQ